MNTRLLLANANALHIPLADSSVQTVVTSPPYYGLRDYGVDGQLGLETTPDEYVANMVAVFREVWRVLRDDGVLFLNLGDSYASNNRSGRKESQGVGAKQELSPTRTELKWKAGDGSRFQWRIPAFETEIKPKDLLGIPWRVAFALQADGWYLRSDIIWHKPNPMPESVTDRPTKAHEYVFLLTKSARYYYDAHAAAEPAAEPERQRYDRIGGSTGHTVRHSVGGMMGASATRNRRSVWTIATQPYAGAHFATMPSALAELCIKAGSAVGDVVFDPFTGSGTTVMAAQQLGRVGVGIDLSHKYLVENAKERTGLAALEAYYGKRRVVDSDLTELPLFQEVA